LWTTQFLEVNLDIDPDRPLISIKGDAGGVERDQLSALISSGDSKTSLGRFQSLKLS